MTKEEIMILLICKGKNDVYRVGQRVTVSHMEGEQTIQGIERRPNTDDLTYTPYYWFTNPFIKDSMPYTADCIIVAYPLN